MGRRRPKRFAAKPLRNASTSRGFLRRQTRGRVRWSPRRRPASKTLRRAPRGPYADSLRRAWVHAPPRRLVTDQVPVPVDRSLLTLRFWNLVFYVPVGVPDTKLELPSRASVVADELERAILSGELRPGEPLVERVLAANFGISKTPVREALKVLSHRGFVEAAPYRAIRVRLISSEEAHEIYQVRSLLEPEAVRLATPHHDEASLDRATAALRYADAARSDLAARASANRRFHRALYEPCPNRLLSSLADRIQGQVALISVTAWMTTSTWADEADEHLAILSALRSSDPELASRLLKDHIEKFTKNIGTMPATGRSQTQSAQFEADASA